MENNEQLEQEQEQQDEVAILKTELAAARADMYNYRQRVEKERAKLRGMVSEERVLDFIPILDNLDRALNVSEDATASDILRGVRMVQRQFMTVLQELGVEPITVEKGAEFDLAVHDAVGMDEVEEEENEGKITSVLLPGYRAKEKVLRPAQVRVGKFIKNSQEVIENE